MFQIKFTDLFFFKELKINLFNLVVKENKNTAIFHFNYYTVAGIL